MTTRLVIIGGGRMGEALLDGLLGSGWARPEELAVVEVVADRRRELVLHFPAVQVVSDVPDAVEGAVIAVKPADVEVACAAAAAGGVTRVLSIAAGAGTARAQRPLRAGGGGRLARPHNPPPVGAGGAPVRAGPQRR